MHGQLQLETHVNVMQNIGFFNYDKQPMICDAQLEGR